MFLTLKEAQRVLLDRLHSQDHIRQESVDARIALEPRRLPMNGFVLGLERLIGDQVPDELLERRSRRGVDFGVRRSMTSFDRFAESAAAAARLISFEHEPIGRQ